MGAAGVLQIAARLGKGDVEGPFPGGLSPEDVLQRKRRLSRAGIPLDEVEALSQKTAHQDMVQSKNASGHELLLVSHSVASLSPNEDNDCKQQCHRSKAECER